MARLLPESFSVKLFELQIFIPLTSKEEQTQLPKI